MAASEATSGYGIQLLRGDGGVGAGVKASLTLGATNSQLVIGWDTEGTAGNGKTVVVVEDGNNTPLSVTVSTTAVTINLETDGSGDTASSVNDVIAALYANSTFVANWFANDGVGDGTGLLAAAASAPLASGAEGAEAFTAIAEIDGVTFSGRTQDLAETTHVLSPGGFKEYVATLRDSGDVSFNMNYLPSNASQQIFESDFIAGAFRNYRVVWTDAAASTDAFVAILTQFNPSGMVGDKLTASATLKITGPVTRL